MSSQLHEVQQAGQRITRYEAPATLDAALELLARHGPRARPVAGGTDLLVELDRGARPGVEVLVELGRIPGLDQIDALSPDALSPDALSPDALFPGAQPADTLSPGVLRIGPLVTHNQVVASAACRTAATPLAQACWEVGSPQLRNRATIAGNLVTASPANDTISALMALGAAVELTSVAGTRRLPIGEFITGFRATALAPGELLTAIEVPRLGPGQRGLFVKLGLRRAQAISVVHLAIVVSVQAGPPGSPAGTAPTVTGARIAIGSVAPTVIEVPVAADVLVGRPLDADAIDAAAAAVTAAIDPIDDMRATADYRRRVAGTMTARALASLAADAQLDRWPVDPPLLWGTGFDGTFPTGEAHAVSVAADTAITTTVNGSTVTGTGAPGENLLDWLRHHAGTNGVKEGCAEGECGACTIHLDGAAVMACLVPAARAAGADIVTVEGLAPDIGRLHPVQAAFVACGAVQCGFCTPGFLMASAKLLEEHPTPTPAQVEAGLAGNLCRCTGYGAIHRALQQAAGAGAVVTVNRFDTVDTPGDRS